MYRANDLQGYRVEGKGQNEELGSLTDICVDHRHWCVRYVVVDAGGWLASRRLLVAPVAFKKFDPGGKRIQVGLTREQAQAGPPFEPGQPITRQQERDCNLHYGWPDYWLDDLTNPGPDAYLQAAAACTIMPPPPPVLPPPDEAENAQTHLHGSKEILSCTVQARDGEAGRVSEIWLNDYRQGEAWSIHHLALEGRAGTLAASDIKRVDWETRQIFTGLTREALQRRVQQKQTV